MPGASSGLRRSCGRLCGPACARTRAGRSARRQVEALPCPRAFRLSAVSAQADTHTCACWNACGSSLPGRLKARVAPRACYCESAGLSCFLTIILPACLAGVQSTPAKTFSEEISPAGFVAISGPRKAPCIPARAAHSNMSPPCKGERKAGRAAAVGGKLPGGKNTLTRGRDQARGLPRSCPTSAHLGKDGSLAASPSTRLRNAERENMPTWSAKSRWPATEDVHLK